MEDKSKERYWCSTCHQAVADIHRRVEVNHQVDKTPQSYYEMVEKEAERNSSLEKPR